MSFGCVATRKGTISTEEEHQRQSSKGLFSIECSKLSVTRNEALILSLPSKKLAALKTAFEEMCFFRVEPQRKVFLLLRKIRQKKKTPQG